MLVDRRSSHEFGKGEGVREHLGLTVIERCSRLDCVNRIDRDTTLRVLIVVERTIDGLSSARQEVTTLADMV